jgi:DNA-binding IscR family transcriptional regulator
MSKTQIEEKCSFSLRRLPQSKSFQDFICDSIRHKRGTFPCCKGSRTNVWNYQQPKLNQIYIYFILLPGGRGYRFQEWLALSALVEITRRHFSDEPPWEQTELAARFGVSNLGNLIDDFVGAGILLRSAEPEGVALARPPENVTVKDILEIVSDSAMHDAKEAGPVADILLRRDQAVQKALEGVTLKSVVVESPSTIVKFPYPGSVAQSRRGIPQQRSNGD